MTKSMRVIAAAAVLFFGGMAAGPLLAQTVTPIPETFFGVSAVTAKGYPKVPLGTLAHGDFAWQRIETSRGHFDFTLFDAYVAAALANGLVDTATNTVEMAITLAAGTPGWAVADQKSCSSGNGSTTCTAPPDDPKDWTDFVTALLQHYNGINQPHVRYYELWNEFNVNLWWTGTDAQMVALAQAAYPIVHQDPNAMLLTPSVAGPVGTASPNSGVTRMTSYLHAGGAAYADGGAFHGYVGAPNGVTPFPMPEDDGTPGCTPYVTCFGSIVTKATQMRAVFDQNGLAGKPIFQTEGSWGNGTVTDPATQVAWITRYTLLQAGLRSSLNLQLAAWFAWANPNFGWGNIQDGSGNPTAAGAAYREVYHWLVGATMSQPCAGAANGVYTCALTRPGGYVAQAVWSTKGSLSYTPPSGYSRSRDVTGALAPVTTGVPITIGAKPVLLEGSTLAAPGAPNIVLILTDDQDVQSGTLPYMPHLQELLVARGMSFPNNLVPLSLCCPSRTTILRGQFPHNTGVLGNSLPTGGFERAYNENVEASTVATLLHGAGYRTVLMGKYLNGYPDTAAADYIPPGWDEWYSAVAGNPYGEFGYTLNENGTQKSYGSTPADYGTDVYLSKAVDFIQRAASSPGQPIFIYFATYAPHAPYTPAPRHAGLFPGITAPKFPSFNEADVSGKPAYISTKPLLTAKDIAGIDTDFQMRLQSLQAVDEAIATIVATLQSTGRLDNTYIVFAADNGYHMGEHRLLPGKYTPYETDIHVPLIIRGPGVPAGVSRSDYTADYDLAETFADLAGVPPLSFSDGRSLKPLLGSSPVSSWRQAFFLEEFGTGEFDPPDAPPSPREPLDKQDLATTVPIPSYYGFQAPGYKFVEYKSGEKELYVASDPYELTNVAKKVDPAILATLVSYLGPFENCVGDACRAAEAVPPPALLTASFTVSPTTPPSGATVTLAASAAGTAPYTFSWTVDGLSQTGASIQIHPSDGAHAVTLDVRDAIGAEAVVTQTVTVGTPPVVAIQSPAAGVSVEAGIPVSFVATGSPSAPGATMTYTWDFGDGSAPATGASVGHAFGASGAHTVTLAGADSRGAVARAAVSLTILRPTMTGASLLLPVVLETPGAGGSYYTSEVTLASRLATPVDVLLSYAASAGGGSGWARVTLAPGQQMILPGVLGWLRSQGVPVPAGTSTRVGTLTATFSGTSSTEGLFLGARTFTADPAGGAGTFGLFYTAAPSVSDTLTVFGLQQGSSQRSNLGLVNASGVPVTLRATFYGPSNQQLSTVDTGLAPWGWAQLNSPLSGTGAASGIATVTRLSGTGSFSAYGVLNDQVTSDGSYIPPVQASTGPPDRLIPIVLSVAGYSSELTLANLTGSPLALTLKYTASSHLGSGTGSGTGTVTLVAGEQLVAPDALAYLRQVGIPIPTTGDAGGSLDIVAATGSASSFAAGARTFIGAAGGGTFGLFYSGLTLGESATATAFIHGLQQNATQRSNLAVVNRGDARDTISLRITYYGPDGSPAGSPDSVSLPPGEWVQFARPLLSRGVTSGWAKIEKLSGSSRFVAYGVLNDQTNSDGSYVPMVQ